MNDKLVELTNQLIVCKNKLGSFEKIWWVWRSWLARQIVALEAKGSNPFTHPYLFKQKMKWDISSVGRALDF